MRHIFAMYVEDFPNLIEDGFGPVRGFDIRHALDLTSRSL